MIAICGAALLLLFKVLDRHRAFHAEEFGVVLRTVFIAMIHILLRYHLF